MDGDAHDDQHCLLGLRLHDRGLPNPPRQQPDQDQRHPAPDGQPPRKDAFRPVTDETRDHSAALLRQHRRHVQQKYRQGGRHRGEIERENLESGAS